MSIGVIAIVEIAAIKIVSVIVGVRVVCQHGLVVPITTIVIEITVIIGLAVVCRRGMVIPSTVVIVVIVIIGIHIRVGGHVVLIRLSVCKLIFAR